MRDLTAELEYSLIVSCQPVRGGYLDSSEIVLATARAVIGAGAAAVRVEGVRDLRAVVECVPRPVIGLIKRDVPASDAFITATWADFEAVLDTGAHIVAVEATARNGALDLKDVVPAARLRGRLVMADVSSLEEGVRAWESGVDFVGTTLSGYTPTSPGSADPDIELVRSLAQEGVRVIAEGRYDRPEYAAAALEAGAYAVTVGSAITRPEHVTGWFLKAMGDASRG